jgi:hypothetical protein
MNATDQMPYDASQQARERYRVIEAAKVVHLNAKNGT